MQHRTERAKNRNSLRNTFMAGAAAGALALTGCGATAEKPVSRNKVQEVVNYYVRTMRGIHATPPELAAYARYQTAERHKQNGGNVNKGPEPSPEDLVDISSFIPAKDNRGGYDLTITEQKDSQGKPDPRQVVAVRIDSFRADGDSLSEVYSASISNNQDTRPIPDTSSKPAVSSTNDKGPWTVEVTYGKVNDRRGFRMSTLESSSVQGDNLSDSPSLFPEQFAVLTADMDKVLLNAANRAPVEPLSAPSFLHNS